MKPPELIAFRDAASASVAEQAASAFRMNTGTVLRVSYIPGGRRSSRSVRLLEALGHGGRSMALCWADELPPALPEGISVKAVLRRGRRNACMVSRSGYTRIPSRSSVVCSSRLLRAQLLRTRRDIDARISGLPAGRLLSRVDEGLIAGALVPCHEMELSHYVPSPGNAAHLMPLPHFVPGPGQAAACILSSDIEFGEPLASALNDPETAAEVEKELSLGLALSQIPSLRGMLHGVSVSAFGSGYRVYLQALSPDGTAELRSVLDRGRDFIPGDTAASFAERGGSV